MASRALAVALWASVVLATGCGNFSNDDLLFLHAIPQRGELESNLAPQQQPASAAQQGLESLGEPSEAYAQTMKASTQFNNMLYGVLGIFEKVLEHPPTRRAPNTRIWGPFRPRAGDPLEARVTMTREQRDGGALFRYTLDVRKDRTSAYVAFITGEWDAIAGGIRVGTGSLKLHAKALRDAGIETGELRRLDTISMSYNTAQDPLTVDMTLVADPTQSLDQVSATYHFEKFDAGGGEMSFELESNVIGGVFSPNERLLAVSRWHSAGAGRAELEILSGDGVGSKQLECWNDALNLVHRFKSWDPASSIGDAASCPTFASP